MLLAFMASDEKLDVNLIKYPPYLIMSLLSCYYKKFFLFLSFDKLIIMCLAVNVYEFILLGVCLASWMYRFLFYIKLVKFDHISLNILSVPSSSETPITHMLCVCLYSTALLEFVHFINFFSLLVP